MLGLAQQPGIKFNATIHKQIIDLIEESGTKGITLNVSAHYHVRDCAIETD